MAGKEIEVGLEMEILKQDFVALVQITKGTGKIGEKVIDTYDYLFAPKDGSTPGTMSIEEMADGLTNFTGKFGNSETFKKDDFNNEIKPYIKNNNDGPEDIKITVDQAFIYYSQQKYSDGSVDEEGKLQKNLSYAFQLSIDAGDLTEWNSFKLKKLSFAVWNCDYPKITEKLHIYNIKDYIE